MRIAGSVDAPDPDRPGMRPHVSWKPLILFQNDLQRGK
jgi:hypothetical protein